MEPAGVYIHVPFCVRKCAYCDFYSLPVKEDLMARYVQALVHQLHSFSRRRVDTVYFGGGTPSLLAPAQVDTVLAAVYDRMDVAPDAEITLEANPHTADLPKLRAFRTAGVNRLSVGVQSTDDTALRTLGRLHTGEEALAFLHSAHNAGFDNISADIMTALPAETITSLDKTVADITASPVCHISAYLLKIMPDTPFGANAPAGLPDDDAQADLYARCATLLADSGFAQYEISNFAKAGRRSRHNCKYWNCVDYLGLGPAAAACLDGQRYVFPRDLAGYLAAFAAPVDEPTALAAMTAEGPVTAEDYILLRLRTADGLSLHGLYDLYDVDLDIQRRHFMEQCVASGLATFDGDIFALTVKGFLVSNAIITNLI